MRFLAQVRARVVREDCQVAIDDLDSAQKRIEDLERDLAELKQKNLELERVRPGSGNDDLAVPISEFEETLRRLVQRTAMIVQSEKCVIMVRDRETGELVARAPACGIDDAEVAAFRVGSETGISGSVFTSGEPAIFHSIDAPSAVQDRGLYRQLRLRNGVTVP